jgi:uncharacterized protein (UPF0335 family)
MSEPSALEIVRRRLADGRTIADSDVHRLVREIDRLRAEVAELNADIEAGKAWLRDIYRPTTVKEINDV